ncbi:patatin-like phospholipase family protein [Mesorhizobium sp. BAC0120]|uniref:patatin-like phospholipase family protein n=1 Tax=Mesorhizobium sp. BAC0120 TaxID=3090670 RepID=UPI00298C55C4|nr:patatin-like phospholipase family protein [Mesorhizobium sp. BAC0120]MDW6024098.1 patatin-like phospholipase family protein [Mesorhizobium sp. BAC0120]
MTKTAAAAPIAKPEGGPSFAVALGGGGARGLAHIHVIEVLNELGIRPTAIAGSSIGAIMGAGMAAGMTGKEIHAYARSVLSKRSEVASRMWRARPDSFREMMEGGFRVGQFNIERILRAFLPSDIPNEFAKLEIPLKVTATDFFGHGLAVLDSGDLFSALAASAAIPAVFRPVARDGRLYIDGGIYNPVPFDLVSGAADLVIAIDVVGAPVEGRKRLTGIELVFGASQLMMQSIIATKLNQMQPAVFLRPPVSGFRVLDFLKIDSVLAETAALKEQLKRAIDHAVDASERHRKAG